MTKNLQVAAVLALAMALGLGSCDQAATSPGTKPDTPTGLTLDHTFRLVPAGTTLTLKPTFSPASSTQTLTWSSDTPAVASVEGGTVQALAPGKAIIKAMDSAGHWAICQVLVGKNFVGQTLDILTMTDEFKTQGVIADFEELTGATVNLTVVENSLYLAKLKALFSSGVGIPDIFVGEAAYIKDVVNLGQSEDLEKAPYLASTRDQYTYAAQMGRDKGGVLRGLSWQTTPGGLIFRRSIAKAVWGTDDLATIQAKFTTWDATLAAGQALAAKGYTLVAGANDFSNVFYAGKRVPYFDQNNVWSVDPVIKTYFDFAKKIRDGGMDSKLTAWSQAWMDEMNTVQGSAKVFGYLWPTWGLFYVLDGQKNSRGDWGLIKTPTRWYMGGTWMNIYQSSSKKDLAWAFVGMHTQDSTYMEKYATRVGDFTSNRKVAEKIKGGFQNPILAGQNHYALFADIADSIDASGVSGEDGVVNSLVGDVLVQYLDGKIASVDEAMKELAVRAKAQFPNKVFP